MNLKQLTERIEELNQAGYSCWFEGLGNGEVKLIVEDKGFSILPYANIHE